jgi:hypothetical protein
LEKQIMTRKLYLGMAALVVFGMVSAAQAVDPVVVEQASTLNISTQFASMQAELESLRAQVQEISYGGGGNGKVACDTCGGCDCYCDVGCGGVYAGVELALLKPHFEEGSAINDVNGPQTQDDPRFNYEATPRFWLGYRNCEGFGIRARYWQFDHDALLVEGPNDTDFYALEMETLDVEATQLVCWGPLQMNFAAGARYARTEALDADTDTGVVDDFYRGTFEGWGPTLALEFRRPLGCGPFAFVGNARGSLLYGNARHVVVEDTDEFIDKHNDTIAHILESQVGVEYRRCLGNGTLSARAVMEGQMWVNGVDVPLIGGDAVRVDNNAGLFGATFGVEYAR